MAGCRKRTNEINHEEIRQLNERFKGIYNSSRDAIAFSNLDGTLIDVNDAFCRLTGYSKEELLSGMTYQSLTPKEYHDREARITQTMLVTGQSTEYEKEYIRKDGSRVPISLTPFAVRGETDQPIGLAAIIKDITELRRVRETMHCYLTGVTRAHEEELKRIARDLHDDVIQPLASLIFDIESISAQNSASNIAVLKDRMTIKVSEALKVLRQFTHELRPDILDRLGLVPALESLATELTSQGVTVRVHVTGSERRLPPEMEVTLFRVAQEALRNVRKHSGASEAAVRMDFHEKKIRLHVIDNGCGFNLPARVTDLALSDKLGLIGMHERVHVLGGILSVKSHKGRGTAITVELAFGTKGSGGMTCPQ